MATWYRTGTIAVTNGSSAVTGTGSAWVDAAINAGDALHAPDGRVYEVATVGGAGALTITPAYLGATASAQAYAIQPTHGIARTWRDSAQSLVNAYTAYQAGPLAGLWDDGTAALPAFAFASDPDTGLYRAAANQIGMSTGGVQRMLLSSTAMQIDVPITGVAVQRLGGLWATYGGTANAVTLTYGVGALVAGLQVRFRATAANTAAATINLDGLGAVACRTVTGVALPAGYIRTDVDTTATYDGTYWVLGREAECGSGPNGTYLRLDNGVQICWQGKATAFINIQYCAATMTYAAAFISAPVTVLTLDTLNWGTDVPSGLSRGDANVARGNNTTTAASSQVWARSGTAWVSGDAPVLDMTATGKWF